MLLDNANLIKFGNFLIEVSRIIKTDLRAIATGNKMTNSSHKGKKTKSI